MFLPNDISFTQPENMCFWWEGSPGEQEGANCDHKKAAPKHQHTEERRIPKPKCAKSQNRFPFLYYIYLKLIPTTSTLKRRFPGITFSGIHKCKSKHVY